MAQVDQQIKIESTCKPGNEAKSPRNSRDPRNWLFNYAVKQTLGQGSFGKVKLGVNKLTGQEVALKFIDHQKVKGTRFQEKFRREIEIHARLSHPNIAQIYEVIEAPQYQYTVLVMEYLKGGDLLDFVVNEENGRVPPKKCLKLFVQLLDAVSFLHKQGIVHRDLKLENIMIDPTKSQIKLIDFGFAGEFTPAKLMSTPCGSPIYTAPEVLKREQYSGTKADVWSLGVILYAMLEGNVPWQGANQNLQILNSCRGNFVVTDTLPEESLTLFDMIFKVDPKERGDIESIYSHPWFAKNCERQGGFRRFVKRMSSGLF